MMILDKFAAKIIFVYINNDKYHLSNLELVFFTEKQLFFVNVSSFVNRYLYDRSLY